MTTTIKKTGWIVYNTKRKKYLIADTDTWTKPDTWTKDIEKACIFAHSGAYYCLLENEIAIKVSVTTTTHRTVTKL